MYQVSALAGKPDFKPLNAYFTSTFFVIIVNFPFFYRKLKKGLKSPPVCYDELDNHLGGSMITDFDNGNDKTRISPHCSPRCNPQLSDFIRRLFQFKWRSREGFGAVYY